ncbi:MAG: divalent cation tolerance protein CutA [Candidatus Pacebacteria bacterium]|nr:divalent cation tolerance protein CutA [Candidatus Paceibacterota bacterium]|tara:strand:+ start:2412 stop:2735 length:324 start_codon:yes stop_codon:yes gene_type:complete
MSFIFIYITNPSKDEAQKVARHLLEKRLIGCANIYASRSLYWWKGKIADENEYTIIGKTTEKKFEKVKKEVEKIHSYKIPCIIKIPMSANEKYCNWLKGEIGAGGRT